MTQAIQNENANNRDSYWTEFEKTNLEDRQPSWLYPMRKAAMGRFAETGFPGTNDEDWRFTNVAPIARLPFKTQFECSPATLDSAALDRYSFSSLKCSRLVF